MLYTDFHFWSRENLQELFEILSGIQSEDIENNLILMFYNPILALGIICDILKKIGDTTTIYKRPSNELSSALQNISHKLIETLNEELIKRVYMETNFKGQTLLRLVVNLDLEPLLNSNKVEELIETLWTGKETYECDGVTAYFSKLTYISKTSLRFLPGKEFTTKDLINQNFDFQYEGEKFWYQYDFRRYSIKYIFTKEFVSITSFTFIIQYVNYIYQTSFTKEVYSQMGFEEQYNYIDKDLTSKFYI